MNLKQTLGALSASALAVGLGAGTLSLASAAGASTPLRTTRIPRSLS